MTLKRWIGLVCAFVVGIRVGNTQPSQPSASTVLANIQQYYANANQLTAQFRQVVTHAGFGTTQTSDGKLWVAKPDKFRFDYLYKSGTKVTVTKTFAYDGSTLWFVDHASKVIYQQQAQSSVLPAAVSFLTNASALSSQFNVSIVGQVSQGNTTLTVLSLTPKQPSAQYKEVQFAVNTSDWHVMQSTVLESNGDTNEFKFYAPNLQASVPASWFQVNPTALPTYRLVNASNAGSAVAAPPLPTAAGSRATTP